MLLKKTGKLALCAMLTALGTVLLFAGAVTPTGKLALLAVALLAPAAAVLQCGARWALGCYAATAIVALLLLPVKSMAILYLLAGYYGVLKACIERIGKLKLEWLLKLVWLNLLLGVCYLGLSGLLLNAVTLPGGVWIAAVALNGAFVLYDLAYSKLIVQYENRIGRHTRP
ncbi:MAG: hypothetical protein PHS97_04360 [Oscillospiraceae bacterium]|nr:hypothetical protein [Oscillospiraceae bacterium]